MKKVLNLLFFASAVFFSMIGVVSASNYTEEQIIKRIQETETVSKEMIDDLTDWSNKHAESVKVLLNKAFLNQFDDSNYSKAIHTVIVELKKNGYVDAASDLENIEDNLKNNLLYVKDSLDIVEKYLMDSTDKEIIAHDDLFYQAKKSISSLKEPVTNLIEIYYDGYYQYLMDKVEKYNTVNELRSLYDEILNKIETFDDVISTLENKLETWQTIYNDYNIKDFEDTIREYLQDYYRKFKENYDKLYTKLENKLQQRLDSRISKIVSDTDLESPESIIARNNSLYEIIDCIEEVKEEVNTKFEKVNSYIKIETLLTYATKYQEKVIERLQEAIDYTREYLINDVEITLKNSSDKSFINIDLVNELIIYNGTDLSSTKFINRLVSNYGNIMSAETYNGNIGTLSKVQVLYNNLLLRELAIIVKGDVAPSGRLDITDVVKICNQMFDKIKFNDYEFIAADMDNNSKIDITDVVKLCDKLFK